MKTQQWLIVPAVVALAVALGACSESDETTVNATSTATTSTANTSTANTTETPIGGDIVAPVTREVNELQGTTVELVVGQVLNIRTGSLPIDSYRGEVANRAVATFAAGYSDGSAQFNPGVTAVAPGATEVIMTNVQAGMGPVTFIVTVTPRR
ncbi:MAG: hypothetical protein WAW85_05405 [Gordonia sp. (in: high G+C Gram-positive bacteria)]|uniref:hypothetical protein n=1 Tax=Gordonia sp. (in: high G+C Gram-positive bacteria) TaxID=84139 RepID=UPI003BB6F0A7